MSITIKESDKVLEKRIIEASLNHINPLIFKAINNIKPKLSIVIKKAIMFDSITGISITDGLLYGELGFQHDAKRRLTAIAEAIADACTVTFSPFKYRGGKITGYIEVGILREDFAEVLTIGEATIRTLGYNLPWLEWLLLEGNHRIVSDYFVKFIPGKGRSGEAIMVPFPGSSWRVPTIHAGTKTNNWLTRAVESKKFQNDIETIINYEIEKVF